MENLVIAVLLALILGGAALYLYRAKKGRRCVGCPDSDSCPHCRGGSCCTGDKNDE